MAAQWVEVSVSFRVSEIDEAAKELNEGIGKALGGLFGGKDD